MAGTVRRNDMGYFRLDEKPPIQNIPLAVILFTLFLPAFSMPDRRRNRFEKNLNTELARGIYQYGFIWNPPQKSGGLFLPRAHERDCGASGAAANLRDASCGQRPLWGSDGSIRDAAKSGWRNGADLSDRPAGEVSAPGLAIRPLPAGDFEN